MKHNLLIFLYIIAVSVGYLFFSNISFASSFPNGNDIELIYQSGEEESVVETKVVAFPKRLSVGDTFSFQGDIRSFSRRESFVKDAIDEVYYDNPVVFRTVGTTKQFNVNKAIDNTYFGNQQESLVSGRFKVEKVYTRNGLTYYDIRQVRQ